MQLLRFYYLQILFHCRDEHRRQGRGGKAFESRWMNKGHKTPRFRLRHRRMPNVRTKGPAKTFFFFPRASTFQLLDKPWSQVSSLLPSVLAFILFYRAQGSAIPLLVDFSSSVASSRFFAFRKSICAEEKVPTNLYEYALGGIRTHETSYTRLDDNLIRHRGDRQVCLVMLRVYAGERYLCVTVWGNF